MEGSRQPFSPPVSPESMAREIAAFELAVTDAVAAAGPDDAATRTARARLGQAYAFAGRLADGVDALANNLAAAERARGADHLDIIVARGDLAWAWRQIGRLPDALAAQQSCVAELDRMLGPGSGESARARVEYARLLARAAPCEAPSTPASDAFRRR